MQWYPQISYQLIYLLYKGESNQLNYLKTKKELLKYYINLGFTSILVFIIVIPQKLTEQPTTLVILILDIKHF